MPTKVLLASTRWSGMRAGGIAAVVGMVVAVLCPAPGSAATLPANFQENTVFSGLINPTAVEFSSDGRVFVAEKSGLVKVFTNLADTTPTTFADLRTNVYNFWDRGLLGLALHPEFPTNPSVYVLYAHDAAIGGVAPRWGTPGVSSDPCPNPPGATADGCVISGRLSKLTAQGDVMNGAEQVLIEEWCQQYPSHSTGDLDFGADGALYVSGGDGASFNFTDWGQDGNPLNPCGDPPFGPGFPLLPPTAEGGALRSQDLRTAGDPASLDGAVLRVHPDTGAALPDNPLTLSSDQMQRRVIAYGLRNPFRFAIRPGTNEVWLGDVGWSDWEEINRVTDPLGVVENFGWPCYEGSGRQPGYDGANLSICENLYGQNGAVVAPYHTYHHSARVVSGEACPTGSSSVFAGDFQRTSGSPFPAEYDGALFFGDYSRDCIWAMQRGGSSVPNPAAGNIKTFAAAAANPVDVKIGPEGDLYYVDFDGGTIRRVRYTAQNQAPTAVATANPTTGSAPLEVQFDGTQSSDPDQGDTLSYAWDLDGDAAYDDATSANPIHTYTEPRVYTASLRVTDSHGASSTASVTIDVGSSAPTARIVIPATGSTWSVGDRIEFSGSGTDNQDGALPPSAMDWSVVMQHCPSNCHSHPVQDFAAVAGGTFDAPDHEYPSHLELRLTVRDSHGQTDTDTLRLDPRTVAITLKTNPGGLSLILNGQIGATPITRTVIHRSTNTIGAPSTQVKGSKSLQFVRWSDGGAQTHVITANSAATYTATYKRG